MELNKNYKLPFSVKKVYETWISPGSIVYPVTKIDILPEPGGYIKLFVTSSEGTSIMEGRFLEIISDEKLVYTWAWDNSKAETQVTVLFTASGDGTEININHKGFTEQDDMDMHDGGWDAYVQGISDILVSSSK